MLYAAPWGEEAVTRPEFGYTCPTVIAKTRAKFYNKFCKTGLKSTHELYATLSKRREFL